MSKEVEEFYQSLPHYLLKRQLVRWLYPLQNNQGDFFPAGTLFEVLREDGDKVNLNEIIRNYPHIGRTICGVSVR